MTRTTDGSGGAKLRVWLDMTFPDRNQGGSGVYARALVTTLRERDDVEVGEIRSGPPGLAPTLRWLVSGAAERLRAAGAQLLHSPNFVVPWNVPVPFVTTVFDLSTRRFPGDHPLEWRAYERWVMPARARSAARVIAISELTRQDAIRTYGLDQRKVVTVYPGVDRRFFATGSREGSDPSGPKLIFPGAPVMRKNLELVLKAMAVAPPESALGHACLQISGASADRFPDHVARIAALGLDGRVRWLGLVPAQEMPRVLAASDVCVYPSLYEGFGFPPLEAMASGTPVVASNASCLPEILGDAALMVDPTNVRAFGDAVEAVLVKPELRAALVSSGRERARQFTWERCAEQTLDVYREALEEGAS
jgi:glycosyltransferase involved in cell wall biosynthesis